MTRARDVGPPTTPLATAISACRRHFAFAAGFSALLNLLFIAPMLYMLQVYDRVVPTQGRTTLLFLSLVLVLGLITLALLDYARSRLLVRAGVRLDRQLSSAVLDATLGRSDNGQQRMSRQSLRSLDTLRQTLTGPAVLACFDAPWTPVYILVAAMIHPYLGLLTLAGAALLTFLGWRNERATREPLKTAYETAAQAHTSHSFSTSGADVVRALGMRRALVNHHLDERVSMMMLHTEASFASTSWAAASKFARLLLQSMALGVGALLAINNQISAGAIFAATFLVGRALAPIDQLVGTWKSIIEARGAYLNLVELFQSPDVVARELTRLPPPEGRLQVETLTVRTAARENPVLDEVAFSVAAGEVVGMIGPSGAGKSTLARVIAGAATGWQGSVRFDGMQQQDWDPERLACHVGYMPQEATLFAGTVKENISRFRGRLGDDGVAIDSAVIEAARLAGVHDAILRLPRGYDYRLELGGRGLSTGQAQRISLARALFGNPRYLILDEPNAHLDAEGDLQLMRTMGMLKERGTTILVAAHKLSILPVVDRLLLLRNGRVELYGLKDEVLARLRGPRAARPQSAA